MCWLSEFSELINPPVRLAAAFDHAGVIALDLVLGLALALLLLVEMVEGVAQT
jgi:hypothetical protein